MAMTLWLPAQVVGVYMLLVLLGWMHMQSFFYVSRLSAVTACCVVKT